MDRGEGMKIARFFAVVFGAIGSLLMVGTVVLSLISLDSPVQLAEVPAAAAECSREVMDAVASGDFTAASRQMYGQPDLGADREPADEMGGMVWDAFVDSISYEFAGECYATDSGIARDATITTMDISSVTENLTARAHALLTERVETAEDMSELYDEENNFREDLVELVLWQAMMEALAEDAQTVTYDVTLKLTYQDGQWWAVPDQTLLQALTGGVK